MKDLTTADDIKLLVNSFYEKVGQDELIGYIFTDVAKVNWDLHLPKMYDFWEAVLLGEKGFKGNTMEVHFKINQAHPLEEKHFERWKAIFFATLDEYFDGPKTAEAKQKAQSIADLMQFKIGSQNKRYEV